MESQANKKGDHSASIAAGSLDKYNAGRHLSPLAPSRACGVNPLPVQQRHAACGGLAHGRPAGGI